MMVFHSVDFNLVISTGHLQPILCEVLHYINPEKWPMSFFICLNLTRPLKGGEGAKPKSILDYLGDWNQKYFLSFDLVTTVMPHDEVLLSRSILSNIQITFRPRKLRCLSKREFEGKRKKSTRVKRHSASIVIQVLKKLILSSVMHRSHHKWQIAIFC